MTRRSAPVSRRISVGCASRPANVLPPASTSNKTRFDRFGKTSKALWNPQEAISRTDCQHVEHSHPLCPYREHVAPSEPETSPVVRASERARQPSWRVPDHGKPSVERLSRGFGSYAQAGAGGGNVAQLPPLIQRRFSCHRQVPHHRAYRAAGRPRDDQSPFRRCAGRHERDVRAGRIRPSAAHGTAR